MSRKKPTILLQDQKSDLQDDLVFLIAQVGSHSQSSFGKQVDAFGLRLAHVGVLKTIFRAGGLTQRELGDALGMFPSNLVRLIDELEEKGLVRRGKSTKDRRSYTLQLTEKGQGVALALITLTRAHQDRICTSLAPAERQELTRLLQKIATKQGLRPGVHPELPGLKSRQQRSLGLRNHKGYRD
jgi:DNA-binding MarR family transcriptional regulator